MIRHGESMQSSQKYFSEDKQTMDPPLTKRGTEQAQKLAQRLKHIYFDKIYSSDLDRATQTADILKTAVDSEVIVSGLFREIDMGDIHKRSWDNFPDIFSRWVLHEEDIPYPNGECGADVWNRSKQQIDDIYKLGYERIAVICHGGTIRSIICGILDIPQQRRFYFGVPPENCSVSIILYDREGSALHTFNDYGHIIHTCTCS